MVYFAVPKTKFRNMKNSMDSMQFLDSYFEHSAQLFPNAIAIENGNLKMTYAEVDTLANQLAHFLQSKGIAPEEKAVILLPRCEKIYPAMLGVLKAGGAYIPLEEDLTGF